MLLPFDQVLLSFNNVTDRFLLPPRTTNVLVFLFNKFIHCVACILRVPG